MPQLALGKRDILKFEETIDFLEEAINIISQIEVGKSRTWKPFQTGIIISTQSFIHLSKYLLDKEGFDFVLGGKFTQDCLENLFSIIRSKHVITKAVQFKNDY